MQVSHKAYCDLAVVWLRRPASRGGPGCQVAFSEARGDWNGESPDAIGFRAGVHNEASVLVEVKITRSDFLADRKKPHRLAPEQGMGLYRYYLAPESLIGVDDLPAGWGLIEVSAKGVLTVRCGHVLLKRGNEDVWQHARSMAREWTIMARVLSRVGDVDKMQGVLKRARNLNAQLARQCDALTAQNKRLNLSVRETLDRPESGDLVPLRARRKEV